MSIHFRYRLNATVALLLCCAFAAADMTFAQPQTLQQYSRLKHFTVRDGLPHTPVQAIVQDVQGFIWIGTPKGLYRHDGYTFEPYRHASGNPATLASDNVLGLLVDRQGTLWVGTTDGLDRYDSVTDSFIHYRSSPDDTSTLSSDNIRALLSDSMGMLWVGTAAAGLNTMDPLTGEVKRYAHDPADQTSLSGDQITVLLEDRAGSIWIGTRGGGLNRYDPDADAFVRYVHDAADETSLVSNDVTALHEDAEGNLWIGTGPSWVHRMASDAPGRFARYHWSGLGSLRFIHEDDSGTLWIGSDNCCIGRYDPTTDAFVQDGIPSKLAFTSALVNHESRDGTLWFGGGEGLLRYDPTPPRVEHIALPIGDTAVNAIYEDREGLIWVVVPDGLIQYDRATDRSMWFLDDQASSVSKRTADTGAPFNLGTPYETGTGCVGEDNNGNLWVVSRNVLSRLNRATGQFTHYRRDRRQQDGLSPGILGCFEIDADGNLWIPIIGAGLNKLNPATGSITLYDPPREDIQNLTITGEGALWLGTAAGFVRFNPDSQTFTDFTGQRSSDSRVGYDVHAAYEDEHGRLWYGAPHYSIGVDVFDPRTGSYSHFASLDLPVYDIQGDQQGRVWIHAGDGVLMYEPGTEQLTTFNEGSGLTGWSPGGSLFINVNSRIRGSGELLFGVEGGIKAFRPDDILDPPSSMVPDVVFTSLQVSSQRVRPGSDELMGTSIWATDRVRLAHDQNTFALDFAALDFRNPAANQYRFMLEPYNESWIEAGHQHEASFVKVPPGSYNFRIQAANSEGVWNENERSLRVTVLPPWWRSVWAYAFYALAFIGGAFAVDRIQRRRLIRQERERNRERELEQAREIERAYNELRRAKDRLVQQEKMASLGQLTAGIAHEIKNPLNFVTNFAALSKELCEELEDALRQGDLEEIRAIMRDLVGNTDKIEEHGRRADSIVRSMMQHARGTSADRESVDLRAFVDEYVGLAYHGKRASTPDFNIEIETEIDENVGKVDLVPQEIGRVLLNLLGNAFDAVHENVDGAYKPRVNVSAQRSNGEVEIRITDNGPGVPDEVRDKVFEPFFTTKPTGSGTGLGLSLSHDIVVQGHGGVLALEENSRQGATFVIRLPVVPRAGAVTSDR